MPKTSAPKRRPISLALQGGGSHGAFQWGVLDRLLEDDRLDIRAVTAASAGAMNAAALITGLAKGGAEGARAQLDLLWREVNQAGGRNIFGASAGGAPSWLKESAAWRAGESLALTMSPYQFNPFNVNPLKRVIETVMDFEAVRASDIALFVSTTAVRQGRSRVFKTPEMTTEVLLASGCLPHLFQAVEIEGEPYWDGGYLANPALWPLFYADTPDDILMLNLNPFARDEVPRAADEIADRLNEIIFNAPLVAELRAVAFVQELIEAGTLKQVGKDRYRRLLIHAVEPGPWLGSLSLSSKFDTEWRFLNDLKARGREAGERWLESCFEAVGERSSVDVRERFL